jgi:UDP-glucuronate decarboxylase
MASPTYYRQHPVETMDANVGGLRLLLDHAVARTGGEHRVAGLQCFSTSKIYGDPDPASIPTPETTAGWSHAPGRVPATTSPNASARRCA